MIDYNPKSWFSLIFDVYSQHIVRILFPLLSFTCAFTAIAAYFIQDYLDVAQNLENMGIFHSLLGIVLGLFLVLRTNSAYDRWWEGRKIWGMLINDTRSFALKLAVFLPTQRDRFFFSYMLPNFAFALKEHLRAGVRMEELSFEQEEQIQRVEKANHKPNAIALQIYERLQARYQAGDISGEQFFLLDKEAKAFLDHLGSCERIKNTPLPYSYSMYIKKFIFIYSLTLPFAFIPHMGYWSVLLVGLVFYILVSIELIAEEIEDPFGLDVNDLPLERLSLIIKTNTKEILLQVSAANQVKQPAANTS